MGTSSIIARIQCAWILVIAIQRGPFAFAGLTRTYIVFRTGIPVVTTPALRRRRAGAYAVQTGVVLCTRFTVTAHSPVGDGRIGAFIIETNIGDARGVIHPLQAFRVVFSGRTTNAFTTEARFVPSAPVTIITERAIQQILMAASTASSQASMMQSFPSSRVAFSEAQTFCAVTRRTGLPIVARITFRDRYPMTFTLSACIALGAGVVICASRTIRKEHLPTL